MRGEVQGECEIVEKMYFNGQLDFVHVELMKGLQKDFVPKRCANCRRWFSHGLTLQEIWYAWAAC